MNLMHDPRAAILSNRTINALRGAGIRTWDALVAEAGRTPNLIRSIDKLGPKGAGEIITALNTAKVPHTIRAIRARAGSSSKP